MVLFIAATVWNAVVDEDESGDPADSFVHEVVAVGPAVAVLLLLLVLAVLRLRRRRVGDRIGWPETLISVGAADQVTALVHLSISDITGPHNDRYASLLVVGAAAVLFGLGWAGVRRLRPSPRGTGDPVRRSAVIVNAGTFLVLSILALVGWVTQGLVLEIAATAVCFAAVAGWAGLLIATGAEAMQRRDRP